MATGRTVAKWTRVYADGYDLSGDARTIGPLAWTFEEVEFYSLTAAVKGALPGAAAIGLGALNALFDNATGQIHAALNAAGTKRNVMVPIGIRAAPAQGDPVFLGQFHQKDYLSDLSGEALTVNLPFNAWHADATSLLYDKPWGTLLHAKGAETAANTAVGVDDYGAQTLKGGLMAYQIFAVAGTGTVTLKVQDAATNTNPSFADLTGATSGAIADTAVPAAGLIALGTAATVRQYLRWQLVFSGITSVTFALAFVRKL